VSLIAIGIAKGLALWVSLQGVTVLGHSAVDLAKVAQEVASAAYDVERGSSAGITQSLARNAPEVLEALADLAQIALPSLGVVLVPGVGIVIGAIGVVTVILTFSHRMTHEEEERWFARASAPSTF
jgi:hypothetical protein